MVNCKNILASKMLPFFRNFSAYDITITVNNNK